MGSLNLIALIAAFAMTGMFSFSAYADPGNVEITDVSFQGGLNFDVLDPDGIKSVTQLAGGGCPEDSRDINPSCSLPQVTSASFNFATNHFCEPNPKEATIEIIDCQADMETETWLLESSGGAGDATCIENCDPPQVVGGELIPIESTSLLLASAQTFSWMIPVVLSVLGIGLFVVSRKSE